MRSARTLFTAAVTMLLLAVVAFTAATASAAPRFQNYVALGDSYTSGPLIPFQRLDPLGCFRSTSNYPAVLANRLRVRSFTDVSCGGADTTNMTQPQKVFLGQNRPQLSALDTQTDLVTLGIGGNDYAVFGQLVGTCPRLRPTDPTGNPCERHFTVNGVDTLKAALVTTQANIGTVLRQIHERAPRAKVLAIGYPRIAPETGYCPSILPFADGDYGWINSIEKAVNAALSGAVAADGASSYVDTFGPSLGHDACAAPGEAWINGKDNKPFAAASYHPLRSGMLGVANIIARQLR